jgi:hypothetical protein
MSTYTAIAVRENEIRIREEGIKSSAVLRIGFVILFCVNTNTYMSK